MLERREQIQGAGWYHGYTGIRHVSDDGLYLSLSSKEKVIYQRSWDAGFFAKFWLHKGYRPTLAILQDVGSRIGENEYMYHDEKYTVDESGTVFWASAPSAFAPIPGIKRPRY